MVAVIDDAAESKDGQRHLAKRSDDKYLESLCRCRFLDVVSMNFEHYFKCLIMLPKRPDGEGDQHEATRNCSSYR